MVVFHTLSCRTCIAWWEHLHIPPVVTFLWAHCKAVSIVTAVSCMWCYTHDRWNWPVFLGCSIGRKVILDFLVNLFYPLGFNRLELYKWYLVIMSAGCFLSCAFSRGIFQNPLCFKSLLVINSSLFWDSYFAKRLVVWRSHREVDYHLEKF